MYTPDHVGSRATWVTAPTTWSVISVRATVNYELRSVLEELVVACLKARKVAGLINPLTQELRDFNV
jgi:hypothetical protein